MLVGLLRGKVDRYLTRPAREIEDILTATVLGSCRYVPAEAAMLPFLRRAVDQDGRLLAAQLGEVEKLDIDGDAFWPRWHDDADDSAVEDAHGVRNGWTEPELVLRLVRRDGTKAWVLVEAKLLSGKSSVARRGGAVTDQLGKYWLDLRREARAADAEPLAVVYLTAGIRRPDDELRATQDELTAKGQPKAPLYWLSWRSFVDVVDVQARDAHPILRDVCELLRSHWQLVPIEPMQGWPRSPAAASTWTFAPDWRWPGSASRRAPWSFEGGTR